MKLLRFALDPAACDGEAANAAARFVHAARRDGLTFDALAEAIGAHLAAAERLPALDVVMPDGRHAGRTLEEIASLDLQYLDWVASEFRKLPIKRAARLVIKYFTKAPRRRRRGAA